MLDPPFQQYPAQQQQQQWGYASAMSNNGNGNGSSQRVQNGYSPGPQRKWGGRSRGRGPTTRVCGLENG